MLLKAAANSNERQKHAAMVMRNGNPLAIGINVSRNNPKYVHTDVPEGTKADIYSYHAERVAMRRAGDCDGAVLYVVRLAGGRGKLSYPCTYCMKEIINKGIKRVVFTTDTGIGIIKV